MSCGNRLSLLELEQGRKCCISSHQYVSKSIYSTRFNAPIRLGKCPHAVKLCVKIDADLYLLLVLLRDGLRPRLIDELWDEAVADFWRREVRGNLGQRSHQGPLWMYVEIKLWKVIDFPEKCTVRCYIPGNFSNIFSLRGRSSLMSEDSSLIFSCFTCFDVNNRIFNCLTELLFDYSRPLTFLASSSNSRLSRMTATKSDMTMRVTKRWYRMKYTATITVRRESTWIEKKAQVFLCLIIRKLFHYFMLNKDKKRVQWQKTK